jgi:CBS domain containing-hemolysin-like protein
VYWLFYVVLAATVVSAFSSLASYALRSFRRTQLEQAFRLHGQDDLSRFDRHLPALKLTASFCRAAANLVLVVAMLYLFDAPRRGTWALLAAAAAAGGIIALFTDAIPHAWASHAGEKFLAACFGVLLALRYALYPVVATMHAFDMPIRRLSGAGEEGVVAEDEAARQEILQVATESHAEGAVDAEEVKMIESVITFGQTQAGKIMTPRTDVFALPGDLSWEEGCRRVHQSGHTRVPVYEGDLDNILGVLYAKDLLQYVRRDPPQNLREVMRKAFFVPETKPLDDLLREFRTRKVHMAVVLDEYGGTAGIVTIEDVLEEIVGEIADEYDRTTPSLMRRVDETAAEVDGRMHIDELNAAMDLHLSENEDYDTLAGFLFSELGYIPKTGETLRACGAEFRILAADERKITRVRVQRRPDEPAGEE